MPKSPDFDAIKEKICRYCAYEERSLFQIRNKLEKFELNDNEKQEILHYLKKENFFDELRFADQFAKGRFGIKKWGKTKISYHLKQHQIAPEIIEQVLSDIPEAVYFDKLYNLAQTKWDQLNEPDLFKKKGKLYRYLQGKGYNSTDISSTIDRLIR